MNADHDQQRRVWDLAAETFDQEADHGLRDPDVRKAWASLLVSWLAGERMRVLDVGCGTGSLSILLAEMGHAVTGIDFSPAMIQKARAKAAKAGYPIQFLVMDAVAPALAGQTLDALVCRHVLWALPEPDRVLQRWANLVRPGGRMILIEGFWHTGAGLSAGDALALLPPHVSVVATVSLSEQSVYWGKAVGDERYALIVEVGQVYISKDEDHIHNDRYQR